MAIMILLNSTFYIYRSKSGKELQPNQLRLQDEDGWVYLSITNPVPNGSIRMVSIPRYPATCCTTAKTRDLELDVCRRLCGRVISRCPIRGTAKRRGHEF